MANRERPFLAKSNLAQLPTQTLIQFEETRTNFFFFERIKRTRVQNQASLFLKLYNKLGIVN